MTEKFVDPCLHRSRFTATQVTEASGLHRCRKGRSVRHIRGNSKVHVSFYGVRGSTPCPGPDTAKYGGNTSCVVLRVENGEPLILDLGTGLRTLGHTMTAPIRARALLTHLHWDHVMGLPFFTPMLHGDSVFDVYGPVQEDGTSFDTAIREMIKPPMFPVHLSDFPGQFKFHSIDEGFTDLGDFKVTSRLVPHIGDTMGFRIESNDKVIAYLPDVQQPVDGSHTFNDAILELAADADLLIHDSQYTPSEFEQRAHWGHCTPEYAIATAVRCNVKSLVLFHHDPARSDAELDSSRHKCESNNPSIVLAREGMTISL